MQSYLKKSLIDYIIMDKDSMKELKRKANDMGAIFNLGKNGITDTFIESVDKYLEVHEIIKLKTSIAGNKDEVTFYAQEVASKTNSKILEVKGFTFVLVREK